MDIQLPELDLSAIQMLSLNECLLFGYQLQVVFSINGPNTEQILFKSFVVPSQKAWQVNWF